MKNIILLITCCTFFIACGGNEEKNSLNDDIASEINTELSEPYNDAENQPSDPLTEGKNLIQQSTCLTCHKENEKVIGPSYAEIAKKYESTEENIDLLSDKIINGSSGTWGTFSMTPHPQHSKEQTVKMVKYILSLK